MIDLASLSRGFRKSYLDHAAITSQLRAWATAYPAFVSLREIGRTRENREMWMLVIGANPEDGRPGVWIDGNMHAAEVAGSSVALAIAEAVISIHIAQSGGPASGLGLPHHMERAVQGALFYVVPRISPDGAEAVLTTGRYVRSVPRDERTNGGASRWIAADLDGDGRMLLMRKQDPTGDFVEHPSVPGLMVPRTLDDVGPFYKLWPEGRIEHFDGDQIPTPYFLGDNYPDLNRNFPFRWTSEPDQAGAGSYPGSEPESRAVIEAASRLPNLYAWLNLHTFGGCFIRPPGDVPDGKMQPFDLAVYRQVGAWAEEITTYPMVSGYAEFLYEPDKPLYGALSEWAYEHRATLSYVCELWDIFARLGMKRPKRFVDYYTSLTREDLAKLARWDAEHNQGRIFQPWKRIRHEQLGEVEVGGLDRRVGLYNPPYEELDTICQAQTKLMLRVAAMLPRLVISRVEVAPIRENVTRVSVTVENHGYLPTYGMKHGLTRPFNEGAYADISCEGCTLEEPLRTRLSVGHLEGWGKGLEAGSQAIFHQASGGSETSHTLRFTALGRGWATVRVGSSRMGFVERRIGIGGGI
ncbi:MAG: peptidase M14 [Deltaproteobacteria bacterium]|nr:peptidase M14 [Deltaproteobacteria bacterium]